MGYLIGVPIERSGASFMGRVAGEAPRYRAVVGVLD